MTKTGLGRKLGPALWAAGRKPSAALLAEARERRAIAIRGRTDVRLLAALTNQRCVFAAGDPWSLVMTRDDEFRRALQGKDAFISRLEGEWW